ncbi:MAG TPA: right-handed parallel beta-helix repeat-containing protein, partial [Bacteroidaceae bacterium]|nr:right-handed parallel beta-helix repeat-containing protein [Bacteroidaceae bacterium]
MYFQKKRFTKHQDSPNCLHTRFFKFVLSVCAMLLTITSCAYAAVYYVDYSNGSDFNHGLSSSSPFKHCPGDNNATNTAGSTTLSAGDTVIFKGGVQYNGQVNLNWSGSKANVITYDGNTAGTWGTGKAIIDGQDTRNWGFYWGAARSYITIDNFEVRNIAHSDSANAHGGIGKGASNADSLYISVRNCYVHDVGEWNNDGVDKHTGCGIKIFRGNNCLIDSNEVEKTGFQGIQLYGALNCKVSNNTIHDFIVWGIDLAGEYQTPEDNVISGNTIYDLWQYDCGDGEGFWTSDCGSNPHTDGIFIRRGSGTNPERTIVENNLFYNNKDFGNSYDGTARIYLSGATDTIIRNNIIINPHDLTPIRIEAIGSGTIIHN